MPSQMLDEIYARGMREHAYGFALYKPKPSNSLKPGSCGYFDETSNWNPILNIKDIKQNDSHGVKPMTDSFLKEADPQTYVWGPKYSTGVREVKMDAKMVEK